MSSTQLLYLSIGVLESGKGVWWKENPLSHCRHHSSSCQIKSKGLGSVATTGPAAHSLCLCSGESITNVSFCSWSSFCSQHAESGQYRQPCLSFQKESLSCKVNFWQELSTVTQHLWGGGREEKTCSIASTLSCYSDILLPSHKGDALLWCWSGTNLDNILTKEEVEGLTCSNVEKKLCDALNGKRGERSLPVN